MGEIMSGTDILSRIQILLDANTANFEQNMQKAKESSVSTFDSIKSSAKVMGVVVAAGATSAVVALSGMAMQAANQAVELEKFALRANTTTQDFQKMSVGAQAYGVEQEKLSDMMKDFNEKLGELTTIGAGGGVDFFEQIAVKTEGSAAAAEDLILKMQKLSGPDALQLYVNKLEEAGVTQQQMSFYLESMASDMTDLIPLLVNGGAGMQLYADAAENAGLVMSAETIEKAKILKEQMYLLDLQMQGAKNQLMQAVIPAFVDIAQAFFSGSEQGLQFTDVASGIASGLRFIAKVAIGAATSVQLVGKTIGGVAAVGAALAQGDLSGAKAIGAAMIDDLSSTALAAAERMDQVSNNTALTTAKQMASLRSVQTATSGVNKGLGELTKKQDDSAKSAERASKANASLNKILRDQERAAELAKRLVYQYGDELLRIEEDLKQDLQEIQEASLKADAKNRYSAVAKAQASARKQLYRAELENELFEHRKTEEEKLADELRINKLRLDGQRGLNKNELTLRKQALDDKFRLELAQIEDEKRLRVNNAVSSWGGTEAEIAGKGESFDLSQERFSRLDQSNELFNSQIVLAETAAEREAIWQAHNDRMLSIEKDYFSKKSELEIAGHLFAMEEFGSSLMSMLDESSEYYALALGMQKAFSIYSSLMAAKTAYAQAFADPASMTVPQKILGAMAVAAPLSSALADLMQINTSIKGQAHDGIDYVPREGTWLLDEGERVVDKRTNADLKSYLSDSGGNGKVNININVPPGYTAEQSQGRDGSVTIDVVEKAVRQSWGQLANPNSYESKQMKANFGVRSVK